MSKKMDQNGLNLVSKLVKTKKTKPTKLFWIKFLAVVILILVVILIMMPIMPFISKTIAKLKFVSFVNNHLLIAIFITCILILILFVLAHLVGLFLCWLKCIFFKQIKEILKWRLPHWLHMFTLIVIILLLLLPTSLMYQFTNQYFENVENLMSYSIKIFLFIFVIIAVEFSGRIRSRDNKDNNKDHAITNLIFSSYYKPKLLGNIVLLIILIILNFFCREYPNSKTFALIFVLLLIIFLSVVSFDIFIIFNILTKPDFEMKLEMILNFPINKTNIVSLWETIWKNMKTKPKSSEECSEEFNRRLMIINVFVSKILNQKNIICERNIVSVTNALKSFNENIDRIDIEPIKLEFIDISGKYNEKMPEYLVRILKERVKFIGKKFNVCELLSLPEMDYKIESPYHDVTNSDDKFAYVDELLKTILESFAKIYKKLDSGSRVKMKERFKKLHLNDKEKDLLYEAYKSSYEKLINTLKKLNRWIDEISNSNILTKDNNNNNKTSKELKDCINNIKNDIKDDVEELKKNVEELKKKKNLKDFVDLQKKLQKKLKELDDILIKLKEKIEKDYNNIPEDEKKELSSKISDIEWLEEELKGFRIFNLLCSLTRTSSILPDCSEEDLRKYINKKIDGKSSDKELTLTQSVVGFIFEKILEKSEKKKEKKGKKRKNN